MSSKSVLIVEDNRPKARELRRCVVDTFDDVRISETDSIAIAGQLIEQHAWTGIVLDLAFSRTQQASDRDDRTYLAGIEILQQLNEMRLPYPVIVATQHASFENTKYGTFASAADLQNVLLRVFPRNFRCLIEVDLGESLYRVQLAARMKEYFK